MRRKALTSLILILAATSLLVGCGETTVKSEAEPAETQSTAAEPPSSEDSTGGNESASEETERSARVGDAITLHGIESSLAMKVTLLDFVANDKSYDHSEYSFEAPERGQKYVSMKLRMENVGSEVYNDSPSNGAVLVDTEDGSWDAGLSFYTHKPDLGSPKIALDDSRVGWITFTVPRRAKMKKFQLALDSGFSDEAGEWMVR
jgi:hypothetical protein